MDPLSIQKTASFVKEVADFGQEISQILQSWETTRAKFDATSVKTLTQLNACVQTLQQVYELIGKDEGQVDGTKRLLTGDGVTYAQVLARECAVAFDCTLKTILAGHKGDKPNDNARFWPSPVSLDSTGFPQLQAQELDKAKINQELDDVSKYTLRVNLRPATIRLGQLQICLLLFVDVGTVGRITKQNVWAGVTSKDFVLYDARIRRAGKMMGVSSESGNILLRPKQMKHKVYVSSDSSSSSSSEYDSDDSRPSARPRVKKGWSGGIPPPPPGWIVPPTSPPIILGPPISHPPPPPPTVPSFPNPGHVEEIEEINASEKAHPPSYVENGNAAAPTSDKKEDPITSNTEVPSNIDQAEKAKESNAENEIGSHPTEDARLLNSKSNGLLMKFKSVFRSKASLEAEMKQVLENSNSSLSAFIINNFEYRKIPHSAFHSLEYTHMRTILSQLNDSTWFKTYSDLTDCEHDTLSAIVGKHYVDGTTVNRELVALKVLKKNRLNAWIRLVEYAMRAHNFLPQFDNYRIVLAITREKKDAGQAKKPRVPVVIVKEPDEEALPRPPDPPSVFDENAARLFDLDGPIPAPRYPMRNAWRVPPGGHPPPPGPPRPPGWRPPPPPVNNRFWHPPPPSVNPFPVINDNAKKFDDKQLSKSAVLKALTTYTAFTIRKAPPKTTSIPIGSLYYPSEVPWMRCLVTKEAVSSTDLDRRVLEFKASGSSIIDMKFQLTDIQSSHLTILMNELTGDEVNPHFEHAYVELSLINRELGLLMHQQGFSAEIIHVIVRRAPKEGTDVVELYKSLMTPPPPPPPPMGIPPFRPGGFPRHPQEEVVIIDTSPVRKPRRRRSLDTISTVSTSSSVVSSGSEDNSEIEETRRVKRWEKDEDPIILKFNKKLKGQDVVQCLLDRWTVKLD